MSSHSAAGAVSGACRCSGLGGFDAEREAVVTRTEGSSPISARCMGWMIIITLIFTSLASLSILQIGGSTAVFERNLGL